MRDPSGDQARRLIGHGGELWQGSLDDPESLLRAMDGVDGVFSVQPYSANEIRQGVALIEAAKRQDVSHFVYSSVASADEQTGIPHFESKIEVEEHLRSSGLQHTIVRPVFFMENWQRGFGDSIRNGQLQQPLSPATTLQMVAVDDIGAFAALAFEDPPTEPIISMNRRRRSRNPAPQAIGERGKPIGELPHSFRWRQRQP